MGDVEPELVGVADAVGVDAVRLGDPGGGADGEVGDALRAGELGDLHDAVERHLRAALAAGGDEVRAQRQGVGAVGDLCDGAGGGPADAVEEVDGAVALGARRSRVLLRHVLPNAMTPVIAAAALGVGNAISLEAGLSFLGLGVQPPAPSWGSMIASGRDALINAPWVALAPGLALILVVVACTLLGDGWRGPGHRGQRELTP